MRCESSAWLRLRKLWTVANARKNFWMRKASVTYLRCAFKRSMKMVGAMVVSSAASPEINCSLTPNMRSFIWYRKSASSPHFHIS